MTLFGEHFPYQEGRPNCFQNPGSFPYFSEEAHVNARGMGTAACIFLTGASPALVVPSPGTAQGEQCIYAARERERESVFMEHCSSHEGPGGHHLHHHHSHRRHHPSCHVLRLLDARRVRISKQLYPTVLLLILRFVGWRL